MHALCDFAFVKGVKRFLFGKLTRDGNLGAKRGSQQERELSRRPRQILKIRNASADNHYTDRNAAFFIFFVFFSNRNPLHRSLAFNKPFNNLQPTNSPPNNFKQCYYNCNLNSHPISPHPHQRKRAIYYASETQQLGKIQYFNTSIYHRMLNNPNLDP